MKHYLEKELILTEITLPQIVFLLMSKVTTAVAMIILIQIIQLTTVAVDLLLGEKTLLK